jgi:DNA-binding winged helix-turn-helix (wHTH) protein
MEKHMTLGQLREPDLKELPKGGGSSGRSANAAALVQLPSESRRNGGRDVQGPDTGCLSFKQQDGRRDAASSEISFGRFRVYPAQFLLLENDEPTSIGSRALQLLIVLLERPGELVSRQQLMDRVWPGIFVEPANLTVHISALRRTLRDGRSGNRFIINIPGRGYSFVAPVKVC